MKGTDIVEHVYNVDVVNNKTYLSSIGYVQHAFVDIVVIIVLLLNMVSENFKLSDKMFRSQKQESTVLSFIYP